MASAWPSGAGVAVEQAARAAASGLARRSATMPTMMSSGTSSPASMTTLALRPNSVPSATASRSMSPVEMCGMP